MAYENLNRNLYSQIQTAKNGTADNQKAPAAWEVAIVTEVCMSKTQHQDKSIGSIKFRRLETDKSTPEKDLAWAKPFNLSNVYPLKGEFVTVIQAPTGTNENKIESETSVITYYYTGPINYKGGVNENSHPNPVGADAREPHKKTAEQLETDAETGTSNMKQPTPNFKGVAFTKAHNIYPLEPLEGDNIIYGRWGNSIRLSTSQINPESLTGTDPTKGYKNNPWSDNENNVDQDPITIIRNGQSDELRDMDISSEGSIGYIYESLQNDKSSIWLTDGQKINSLESMLTATGEDDTGVATTNMIKTSGLGNVFEDWGKATAQVIIAADRLIFTAKDDEVLIFGKNGIGLASDNDIVIESADTITISAPVIELAGEVKLGVGGGQSAINGEKLIELLEDLIDEVMTLPVITATGPGTASPSPNMQKIKDALSSTLSSGDDQA